jgi:hypothetical protein
MLALDFLSATFTDGVLFCIKITRVGALLIGVVVRQSEGIEQRFELEEYLILPTPKDIGQYGSRAVINGMPEESREILGVMPRSASLQPSCPGPGSVLNLDVMVYTYNPNLYRLTNRPITMSCI